MTTLPVLIIGTEGLQSALSRVLTDTRHTKNIQALRNNPRSMLLFLSSEVFAEMLREQLGRDCPRSDIMRYRWQDVIDVACFISTASCFADAELPCSQQLFSKALTMLCNANISEGYCK